MKNSNKLKPNKLKPNKLKPNKLKAVKIATASAIVTKADDPYMVLVADSKKHAKPVIPGGKIDREDVQPGTDPGLVCIFREVAEEIGGVFENAVCVGVASDPRRDVRDVPYSKIKESLTDPVLPADTPDDEIVRASYGCPDYIYVGSVQNIADTEELLNARFIDIRTLKLGDLSAGHDVVVLMYRDMLDLGAKRLSLTGLLDFDKARQKFFKPTPSALKPN